MSESTIRRSLVDPASPSSESFRTLRLALQLRSESEGGRAGILFTSAEPQAGKSTMAANYALVSALGGARVLLVDADLRKPAQQEIFGVSRAPGLVELLATGGDLGSFSQRVRGFDDLYVLPAGREVSRSSDLASSRRMHELLHEAVGRFDLVVVDSPPVLVAADAEGLASHPDIDVVFVVNHTSKRRAVSKALRRLELIEARIAGLVLNREGRPDTYAGAYSY